VVKYSIIEKRKLRDGRVEKKEVAHMKVGCLGPRGAFSEKAARELVPEAEFVLYKNIFDILADVENGALDAGVAPIQNSTEGVVNVTVDALIFDVDLFIQKELVLPVRHSLLANKKALRYEKILSHPQALAQCRAFLKKKYPDARLLETASTSDAARLTSESDSPCACVASDDCAGIYGLETLWRDVQDSNQNKTYFVLVLKNKNQKINKKTLSPVLNKKISIAFSAINKPGELYRILSIFMLFEINLTQIVSRPMRGQIDEYVFLTDIEASDEQNVLDAFEILRRKTKFFKFLGRYGLEIRPN
jgi:prephenate dehydratase